MKFPDKKELERIRKKLDKVEPTRPLPKNANKSDRLKYDLCKQFVIYLREHDISKKELADELGIEAARISEIVKYRIELFTVDRLLTYVEQLNPDIQVIVA